jgi:hypothetical protein
MLILLLTTLSPFLGILTNRFETFDLQTFLSISSSTKLSMLIAYPAKIGAVFGVLFFSSLTFYEFDRVQRAGISEIVYVNASSIKQNILKMISLVLTSFMATILATLIYMPYFLMKMRSFNGLKTYFTSFLGIMFTSIVFSVLLSAGIYLMTKYVNLAIIAMLFLILGSFSAGITLNYLYNWIQSPVTGFSSFFGYAQVLTALFWNRLFCFGISLSVFISGLLCDRRYQKGLIKSIFYNCKKYKFLLACFFVAISIPYFSFTNEPLFKKISLRDTISVMANQDFTPFTNNNLQTTSVAKLDANINTKAKDMSVVFEQQLENLTSDPQKIYIRLPLDLKVNAIKVNGVPLKIKFADKSSFMARVYDLLEVDLPAEKNIQLKLAYGGFPKNLNLVIDFSSGISKDYVFFPKSKFLPNLLIDKKFSPVKGVVRVDANLTIVTTGKRNKKLSNNEDGTTSWSYSDDQMEEFALCAAKYKNMLENINGMDIEFYYPHDQEKNFHAKFNDIKTVLNFFVGQLGPLDLNAKPLKIVLTSGVTKLNSGEACGNFLNCNEGNFSRNEKAIKNKTKKEREFEAIFPFINSLAALWWDKINISNQDKTNIHRLDDELAINNSVRRNWTSEAFLGYSYYAIMKEKFGERVANRSLLRNFKERANSVKKNFYIRNPKYLEKLSKIQQYFAVIDLHSAKTSDVPVSEICQISNKLGSKIFSERLKKIYQYYQKNPDQTLTFADFLNGMGVDKEAFINE